MNRKSIFEYIVNLAKTKKQYCFKTPGFELGIFNIESIIIDKINDDEYYIWIVDDEYYTRIENYTNEQINKIYQYLKKNYPLA